MPEMSTFTGTPVPTVSPDDASTLITGTLELWIKRIRRTNDDPDISVHTSSRGDFCRFALEEKVSSLEMPCENS